VSDPTPEIDDPIKTAPRNRTVRLDRGETEVLRHKLLTSDSDLARENILDKTILGDCFSVLPRLPRAFADLAILDPPYNRGKTFGDRRHGKQSLDSYCAWLGEILDLVLPTLKPTASVYVCGDWQSTAAIQTAASSRLKLHNRITWEREKGRGAARNWKNCSEDIWFCTLSDRFTFNRDAVMTRRRVIAPYRENGGRPKDWQEAKDGRYRDTAPSNLWTDLTVPFWSMPENTEHPTQKPEKLIAKLILASSNPGDVILDPFSGSGTSAVVAKKLDRRYVAIEREEGYALLTEKRLALAEANRSVQGFADGVFWERNSKPRKS